MGKAKNMRKIAAFSALAMFLISIACAEDITGTWSGSTGGQEICILELAEDGTGTIQTDGKLQPIVWDESHHVYVDGEKLASLTLQDGFLIFRDARDEVWPLMRNAEELPARLEAAEISDFYGEWKADFAVVSGFRIPMEDMEIIYSIQGESAVLSGTAYETPITLPVRLADGSLVIDSNQEDMSVVLSLREDGSMTRDMAYMTIHYVR